MATLKRFEEMEVWRDSIQLAKEIYLLTQKDTFKNDWALRDQIRRASVSVSNNIAEGFEYNNNNHFIKYLKIAKGSCGEVRSMVILMYEIGYLEVGQKEILYEKSNHICNRIGSLISYLQKEKIRQLAKS